MRLQILLIKWRDSGSLYGWQNQENINRFKPVEAYTGGILVEEAKDYIKLVQTYCEDGDKSNAFVIPRGCILKKKVIGHYDTD